MAPADEHGLLELLRAEAPSDLPPAVERVDGPGARAAWALAARLATHDLPGPRPLALTLRPEPRALLGHGDRGLAAVAVEGLPLPPVGPERADLLAALADRGLVLASDVPAAFRRLALADGSTCLGLASRARLADLPLGSAEETAAAERLAARRARRQRRARLLRWWPRLSNPALRPLSHGALALAGAAARWSPLEARLRRHLAIAYPDRSDEHLAALARGARRHMARQARELGRLGRGPEREGAWLDRTVRVDDSIELLDRQLAAGRGVLIVTPHLGSWELLAATLRRRGHAGAVVGRRRGRDPGGAWLEELRARWDVETLPQDVSPRELLRRLARNEVIGLLPDLEVPRLAGLRMDFLGRDALVMSAPAALARAARLPLLPARCVREGAGYRLDFGPLLEQPEAERDPRPLTEAWVRLFEAWIREAPEQWIWYHDRWRTPPGPADGVPLAALRQAQRP